jgi:hypothetical protein
MLRSWLPVCIFFHLTLMVFGQQDSINKPGVKKSSGIGKKAPDSILTLSDTISDFNKNLHGRYLIHEFLNDTIKMTPEGLKALLSREPSNLNYKLYRQLLLQFDTTDFSIWNKLPVPETYEELKKEFLDMPFAKDESKVDLRIRKEEITPYPETGAIIKGPFSALYEALSRHSKINRKYLEMIKNDQIELLASKAYNKDVVQKITGLQTEKELQEFMNFCPLRPELVVSVNKYELYLAIKNCYKEYQRTKK